MFNESPGDIRLFGKNKVGSVYFSPHTKVNSTENLNVRGKKKETGKYGYILGRCLEMGKNF